MIARQGVTVKTLDFEPLIPFDECAPPARPTSAEVSRIGAWGRRSAASGTAQTSLTFHPKKGEAFMEAPAAVTPDDGS
jgi:hypothetical protein